MRLYRDNEGTVHVTGLAYVFGDEVYLRTDVDQRQRLVTGVVLRPNGALYTLACGDTESSHYEYEITNEKTFL